MSESAVIREKDLPAFLGYSERATATIKLRPDFPRARDLSGSGKKRIFLRAEVVAWLHSQPAAEYKPEPQQLRDGRLARERAEQAAAAATAERSARGNPISAADPERATADCR